MLALIAGAAGSMNAPTAKAESKAKTAPAEKQELHRALRFVKQKHQRVQKLLESTASAEVRSKKLGKLLDGFVAYDALAESALSSHWSKRSAKERKEFVNLLTKLIQQNYERNMKRTLSYKVSYSDAIAQSDGVLVRSTARSGNRRAEPIKIDYLLKKRADSNLRVVDITTDGVSLVSNYRSQFNRIIKKSGWDDLIARMKKRLK